MLKLGNKSISNLFIGQKAAAKAFLGQKLVWQKATGLPYDAEVEYLESTGTQWIDTGIALSNASLADITWMVEVMNFNDGCMGVYGQSQTASMYFNLYANKFYMRNMRTSGGNFAGVSGFNTIRFSGGTSYLNGTAVETDIPLNTNPTNNMFLFAYNRSNAAQGFCKARVSSFTVKVGDVLIADFIPVRVGGVGYMYDRVSKHLFGNQGSGNFIVGPDVVEVEYLESTGTQWIDTGVVANGEFDAEYAISTPSVFNQFIVAGARSTTQHLNFGQYVNDGNFVLGYLDEYWIMPMGVTANTTYTSKVHYAYGSQSAKLNGVSATSKSLTGTEALDMNIYLFKRNFHGATDTIAPMVGRMYSFKMWQDGVLVRDFIPVRVGMEGAMMDRLTRKIYRNAGTGAFKIGADKKETPLMCNSYVKDGLVAMWDGVENAGWGTHDANATTWKDLVGGGLSQFLATPSWAQNGLSIVPSNNTLTFNSPDALLALASSGFSIEIVAYMQELANTRFHYIVDSTTTSNTISIFTHNLNAMFILQKLGSLANVVAYEAGMNFPAYGSCATIYDAGLSANNSRFY